MTEDEKTRISNLRLAGRSVATISRELGLSMNTVKSYCKRHAVAVPSKATTTNPATDAEPKCANCGKRLRIETRRQQRFCSEICRRSWWRANGNRAKNKMAFYRLTCSGCKKIFDSYGNRNRKYCSHACYINDRYEGRRK